MSQPNVSVDPSVQVSRTTSSALTSDSLEQIDQCQSTNQSALPTVGHRSSDADEVESTRKSSSETSADFELMDEVSNSAFFQKVSRSCSTSDSIGSIHTQMSVLSTRAFRRSIPNDLPSTNREMTVTTVSPPSPTPSTGQLCLTPQAAAIERLVGFFRTARRTHLQHVPFVEEPVDPFVHVDAQTLHDYEPNSVSAVLAYCKNRVLGPYFRLMGLAGIRPLIDERRLQNRNLRTRYLAQSLNTLYTFLLLLLLICGRVLHTLSCYQEQQLGLCRPPSALSHVVCASSDPTLLQLSNHTSVDSDDQDHQESLADRSTDPSVERCSNLLLGPILSNCLWMSAYLFTVFLMRTRSVEKTEYLLERCFLQCNRSSGWFRSHRRLLGRLRLQLSLALVLSLVALCNLLLQVFTQAARFFLINVIYSSWVHRPLNQSELGWLALGTSLTGCLNELTGALLIATYGIHCEFNISYLKALGQSVRERRIDLQASRSFASIFVKFHFDIIFERFSFG